MSLTVKQSDRRTTPHSGWLANIMARVCLLAQVGVHARPDVSEPGHAAIVLHKRLIDSIMGTTLRYTNHYSFIQVTSRMM